MVVVEGDAARKPNFLSGSGLNLGVLGLPHLLEIFLSIYGQKPDLDSVILSKNQVSNAISQALIKVGIQNIPGQSCPQKSNDVELGSIEIQTCEFLLDLFNSIK